MNTGNGIREYWASSMRLNCEEVRNGGQDGELDKVKGWSLVGNWLIIEEDDAWR